MARGLHRAGRRSALPDPLDEDVAILDSTTDAYSPNKAEVERRLRATELPISILRPGAIHGPASPMLREWYFIKRVLDGRPFAILAYDGESLFSTTDTRNVAELIALCAENPGARLLNAVDEELLTVAEIGRTVFDLMGHDATIRTISGPPRPDGVGDNPWALAHPLRMPMDRARRDLGYRQAVSYRDGMTDAIEALDEGDRAADRAQDAKHDTAYGHVEHRVAQQSEGRVNPGKTAAARTPMAAAETAMTAALSRSIGATEV